MKMQINLWACTAPLQILPFTFKTPRNNWAFHAKWFEPPHNKTNKMTCAPSEDSDQPAGHPSSHISVFAVRMKKAWVLSYTIQQRIWSDWVDAQADLSLWGAHMPFCWFCHEAAQIMFLWIVFILSSNTKFIGGGGVCTILYTTPGTPHPTMYYIRPLCYNIVTVTLRLSHGFSTQWIGYYTMCIGA